MTNPTLEKVTPLFAEKLLETNTNNYRKLNTRNVDKFVAIIKKGAFNSATANIIIDTNGTLVDGQHRLHAVIKSGIATEMIVVTGAKPETKYVVDAHMPRRMKDHCQCDAYVITMINTFLRAEGIYMQHKDDVEFYLQHVNGSIGDLATKLNGIFTKTYSPFTSVGLRAGLILGVLTNQITEQEALDLFEKLSNLRKKTKKKDNTADYAYTASTRAVIVSSLNPLMSRLVDALDNDKLPVQSPVDGSNSWYTESYADAREKASKLMKATYLAVAKPTRNDTKFKGSLTKQIRKALEV